MPRKSGPRRKTSVSISAEAHELLTLMAAKARMSPSEVVELAIRERAEREKVTRENGAAPVSDEDRKAAARERFLALLDKAQRHASNDNATPEELEREVTLAFEEVRAERRAGHG